MSIDRARVDVNLDVHVIDTPARAGGERATAIHCRHATRRPVPIRSASELEFWITRTGRYEYTIDERMLARVDVAARVDAPHERAADRLGRLLGAEQGMLELRNIQRDTPLWHLGLRTGDRLLSIGRAPGVDRVEVALARRGRPLVLTYRVV
ncbi:hypothetical protein ACNOYE_32015 [Nannocystaceae bacterium ST9]